MKKKGQRTFNNENVHRVKMHARLLDVFHQRGKVIDSLPASKTSAPSETKCLTSLSLSRPQKLFRDHVTRNASASHNNEAYGLGKSLVGVRLDVIQ